MILNLKDKNNKQIKVNDYFIKDKRAFLKAQADKSAFPYNLSNKTITGSRGLITA